MRLGGVCYQGINDTSEWYEEQEGDGKALLGTRGILEVRDSNALSCGNGHLCNDFFTSLCTIAESCGLGFYLNLSRQLYRQHLFL